MRRFVALGLVAALVVVVVVALSGCGAIAQKATEAAVESATGVKVDSSKQTITTTDKDGNTTELSAKEGSYPDGFPSDFPQYPGAKVDSALKGSSNGQDSFTVILKTADAPKDVYAWYLGELENNGWKIDQKLDATTDDSAFATITCTKGELRGGVSVSRDKDETETSMMIGLNPVSE